MSCEILTLQPFHEATREDFNVPKPIEADARPSPGKFVHECHVNRVRNDADKMFDLFLLDQVSDFFDREA